MTALLGVLGHPVAHSLSPAMHSAALDALGLDAAYVAIDVPVGRLARTLAELRRLDARGLNVTMPLKEAIVPLLVAIDDEASAIGAVNTLLPDPHGWRGTNTDAEGLLRSLEESGEGVEGASVVVLGAGGAARAAVHGLTRAGAAEMTVVARRVAQADVLLQHLGPARRCAVDLADESSLVRAFERADLVVQATGASLQADSARDLVERLPLACLPDTAAVIDLVYRPRRTALLEQASARGLRTVDGIGMLVHQGAHAFEQWLGLRPPTAAMRAAVERALG